MPSEDTQFKKGKSGNPAGRPPKKKCIPDLIRRFGLYAVTDNVIAYLDDHVKDVPPDINLMEAIILRTMIEAVEGEGWAVNFIAERTEGKVKETAEVEETIPVEYYFDD